MMSDKDKKDLKLVDGLFHDLAENEAKRGKMSAKDREAVEEVKVAARSAIQEARRAALTGAREERLDAEKPALPERILKMTKDAIIERLRELEAMFPGEVAVQHRKLEDTPLEDLRSLLADFEAQIGHLK
jgi:hypothetical protein